MMGHNDMSNMGCKGYLYAELHAFSEECSVIGVRPAMDTKRHWFSRLIWTTLVLVGVALAIYQIQSRIVYYFSYPTSTSVSILQADSLPFPQVTICNENKMMRYVAAQFGFENVLPEMFPNFPITGPGPNISFMIARNYSQEYWDYLQYNLAQPLQYTLSTGVVWGTQLFKDPYTVMTTVWTDMGLCFAFNAGGANVSNFTTSVPGATLGLFANLQTIQSEYLVTNSACAGFRILLHDPKEIPMMLDTASLVTPGTLASVSFTLANITELGPPYTDCNDSEDYRQVNCQVDCQRDLLVKACGCRLNYMPGTERNCTIIDQYKCVNPFMSSAEYIDKLSASTCNCPPQCTTSTYQLSVTTTVLSEMFKYFITSNYEINSPTLVEDFAGVQIFYSTMQYTQISMTAAYEFMALLSAVGGALGLMLGATLITLFEISEFIFKVVTNLPIMGSDAVESRPEKVPIPDVEQTEIQTISKIHQPVMSTQQQGPVTAKSVKIMFVRPAPRKIVVQNARTDLLEQTE